MLEVPGGACEQVLNFQTIARLEFEHQLLGGFTREGGNELALPGNEDLALLRGPVGKDVFGKAIARISFWHGDPFFPSGYAAQGRKA